MKEEILSAKNIEVLTAAKKFILKGINLQIFSGEVLSLAGESGSGKSTLALALTGLLPASLKLGGEIIWQKRRFDLAALRKDTLSSRMLHGQISYIFQEPSSFLNPTLNIAAQLTEVFIYNQKKAYPQALDLSRGLLELVGIKEAEKKLYSFPHQLSGGEAQRVMIAMALAQRPKLLIADEPTSNLDVTIEMEILSLIKNMQQRFGFAVLFITHDLSLVRYFSQRVVFLKAGRIVEESDTAHLKDTANPYVQSLLEAAEALQDYE
ncbi:MAG: ABC transporter ATP-binding protein [Candidatus Omnitrophica bacterium]|nr:ABC transporter ATP-binding protein [Candidatus Omnitrophota bacterium]